MRTVSVRARRGKAPPYPAAMPRTRWITADTHFGDAAAIDTFARPFTDAVHMDEALMDAINRSVRRGDELLHLGDVFGSIDWSSRGARADARRLIGRIRCRRVRLVIGNKDPARRSFLGMFRSAEHLRSEKSPVPGGVRLRTVLCHYPLRQWQGLRDGALHMHGHAHGSLVARGRSLDVGVDAHGFAPLRMDDAIGRLLALPVQPPL
jgi:calcineurin-like phosphoesterase family protein